MIASPIRSLSPLTSAPAASASASASTLASARGRRAPWPHRLPPTGAGLRVEVMFPARRATIRLATPQLCIFGLTSFAVKVMPSMSVQIAWIIAKCVLQTCPVTVTDRVCATLLLLHRGSRLEQACMCFRMMVDSRPAATLQSSWFMVSDNHLYGSMCEQEE